MDGDIWNHLPGQDGHVGPTLLVQVPPEVISLLYVFITDSMDKI